MNIDPFDLLIFALISFPASLLSAIGGGGGGFVMIPLYILLGLSPQQAIVTGKVNALAMTGGVIGGLTKQKQHNWNLLAPILVSAVIVGLISPRIILGIDNDSYATILGLVLLFMIPAVLFKGVGHRARSVSGFKRILGFISVSIGQFVQGVLSTGTGVLVNLAMMSLLGMSALEANISKRISNVVMNGLIIIGLLSSGLVVLPYVLVGWPLGLFAGWLGVRIAIKKGEVFASRIFVVVMFAASVQLLLG